MELSCFIRKLKLGNISKMSTITANRNNTGSREISSNSNQRQNSNERTNSNSISNSNRRITSNHQDETVERRNDTTKIASSESRNKTERSERTERTEKITSSNLRSSNSPTSRLPANRVNKENDPAASLHSLSNSYRSKPQKSQQPRPNSTNRSERQHYIHPPSQGSTQRQKDYQLETKPHINQNTQKSHTSTISPKEHTRSKSPKGGIVSSSGIQTKLDSMLASIHDNINTIQNHCDQLNNRLSKPIESLKMIIWELKIVLRLTNAELNDLAKNRDFYDVFIRINDILIELQDFLFSLLGVSVLVKARFNKPLKKRLQNLERHIILLGMIAGYLRSSVNDEALGRLSVMSGYPKFESVNLRDRRSWYEQAESYYRGNGVTQDYKIAYRFYKEAANLGDPRAQFMVGKMCLENMGVDGESFKILETGIDYLLRACEQENADALNYMGQLHMKGLTDRVPKEPSLAVNYFTVAVKKGHQEAMCNLAVNLLDGVGCTQNLEEAFRLVTKCVEKNHPRAITLLGKMYYYGTGVIQDYDKAVELFKRAAEMNNDSGLNSLGVAHEEGNGVVKDIKKAAYFYERAKDLGNMNAYSNLGYIKLIQKEYLEGHQYLTVAAEQGHIDALFNLGQIYQQGLGVNPDISRAYQYFLNAARGNHFKACTKVGDILFSGDKESGIEIDYKSAFEFYTKAARKGNDPDAQNALGIIYEMGIYKSINYQKSIYWYKAAIESSGRLHSQALFNLGGMYLEGKGCEPDKNMAIKLFTEAAELGHQHSIDALSQILPNQWQTSKTDQFSKYQAGQSGSREKEYEILMHSTMTPTTKSFLKSNVQEPYLADSPLSTLSPIQKQGYA